LPRVTRVSDFRLNAISQNVEYPLRQRRSIVPIPPNLHFGEAKRPCCCTIGAKGDFEREIILAAGQPAFEARSRYELGTLWHEVIVRWLRDPRRKKIK
jgi:hypothetical protein